MFFLLSCSKFRTFTVSASSHSYTVFRRQYLAFAFHTKNKTKQTKNNNWRPYSYSSIASHRKRYDWTTSSTSIEISSTSTFMLFRSVYVLSTVRVAKISARFFHNNNTTKSGFASLTFPKFVTMNLFLNSMSDKKNPILWNKHFTVTTYSTLETYWLFASGSGVNSIMLSF